MYETPTLNPVGNAEKVILGVALAGYDIDATSMTAGSEFEDDAESEPH